MPKNTLADSEERLAPYIEGWDKLSVECRRPLTAPGWMLSWWRNSAPDGAGLRVVVVEDGDEVIGLGPYYSDARGRRDYRMLGSGLYQRIEPLATPGREPEVADAIAKTLLAADPKPLVISLEGTPRSSPWPKLLKRRLGPLGAASYMTSLQEAPVVTLEGDFDSWLASKSSNFRSQMKRARKKIEKEGGAVRMSGADEVEADIAAFLRLHEGRWEGRGESAILLSGMEAMLRDAARALLPSGRFRLWMADLDGKPISAQMFVAAGGEVAYWNGGFDEEYGQYKPAMVAIFAAIEHAFGEGDDRLDLGGGAQDYKLRFADSSDGLRWGGLIPRGPRWPVTRAQLLPDAARGLLRSKLSADTRTTLKKILRRG